jgi:hypothetical protein
MRFFLALARGDIGAMETILAEICKPNNFRWRSKIGVGHADSFVIRAAVIYAKLAWGHGYRVYVDTPFIPVEWLPVAPLAEFHDPYTFMAESDAEIPSNWARRTIRESLCSYSGCSVQARQ